MKNIWYNLSLKLVRNKKREKEKEKKLIDNIQIYWYDKYNRNDINIAPNYLYTYIYSSHLLFILKSQYIFI